MNQDNTDQAAFWTTDAGHLWVQEQAKLDVLFQPVLDGVLERAGIKAGQSVLDIGCGTGDSTLRAAQLVGPNGTAMGVDISPTMLAQAEMRAATMPHIGFRLADASTHVFDKESFNHLISRFGVMFFADPEAAFATMRAAMKPGARVTFATWGAIASNPWFTIPAQAAKAHLGAPPKIDPDAPGPFAFRDPERVAKILSAAGYTQTEVDVAQLCLTPPGSIADVAQMATNIGPASRTVAHFGGNDTDLAAIARRVEAEIAGFATPSGVHIPAEINFFQACA